MDERKCINCDCEIPSDTEHFELHGETYCTDCVEVTSYTAYTYRVDGEWMGTSEDGECIHIESYDDDH